MRYLFITLSMLFFVGLAGSALVILLTFIDDAIATLTPDTPAEVAPSRHIESNKVPAA